MALTEQQKRMVDANLKTLDYLEGTGILNNMKKRLSRERFLFISTGGTGHKLMKVLKENLIHHVSEEDIRNRVSFLVIDTDHAELELLRKEGDHGIFENTELLKLPYQEARRTIAPATRTPQVQSWVHPDLYSVTGGDGRSVEFSGAGAGAYRQVGRVHLSQRTALEELRTRIIGKIRTLAAHENNLDRINVFFFCGIAGGTGSGTIIDLAFLTRYFIKSFNGAIYSRTRFRAYLMLPSACGYETDFGKKTRGNRNAYAALKEIDYFMNVSVREEHYHEEYDGITVDLNDNIFDFCTLVEGVGGPGIIFENQNQVAMQVTADSIINMITDTGLKDDKGNTQFLVDSFLCNRDITSNNIRMHSYREWPRNAHYVYNVIGYSECVVPIDLMVVYVAKKVFDQVWELFLRCGRVTDERVDVFLSDCGLDAKTLKKSTSFTTVKNTVEIEMKKQFEKNGPYYLSNLLMDSVNRLQSEDGMYRKEALKKANGFWDKEKWEKTVKRYDKVIDEILIPWNQNVFEIYTYVIDCFKVLLEKNAGILTETTKYQTVFGNSYCWSPIDLTKGNEACEAVRLYLDCLIPEKEVEEKAKKFVRKLIEKREEWTQLTSAKEIGKFNAAKAIREFVESEIFSAVNTTLEGFLVKRYSESDESVTVLDESGKEIPSPAVAVAAKKIVEQLEKAAAALAQSDYLENCYRYRYITIPTGCKWLKAAIKEECENAEMSGVKIYESSAQDRVVLYRLYGGVAAYMLNWVKQAESDYEADVNYPGLHISQSKTGKDWTRFPNLYVESLWMPEERQVRKREALISQKVKEILEKAKSLQIIAQQEDGYYTAILPVRELAADKLEEALVLEHKTYDLREILAALEKNGLVEPVKLKYTRMIVTTTENPKPKDFEWQLAQQAVRLNVPLMDRISEGVQTIERIAEQTSRHNEQVKTDELKKQRLNCLIDSRMIGFLVYEELRKKWILELPERDQRELVKLEKRVEVECREYYGAEAFFRLDEETYADCCEAVNRWKESAEDETLIRANEERQKYKEEITALRGLKKQTNLVSYPMASMDFVEAVGEDESAKIRDFYDRLIREL